MIESLFPPETQLLVDDIQVQTNAIEIYARRRATKAQCPDCQRVSEKIHSHYHRHPHDLPCFGYRVQLHLKVRRFFCRYTVFDRVFESEGIHVIPTPLHAPNANAYAERWVRTVREECLDHVMIINETHLRRVLKEYFGYYEIARPHQGLHQQMPVPRQSSTASGLVQKREVLGGIINDYYRTQSGSSSYLH